MQELAPPDQLTVLRSMASWIPRVTMAFALLCIGVFAFEVARFSWDPSFIEVHLIGGFSIDALSVGLWSTPATFVLLHLNVVHLAVNVVALLVLGTLVERSWRPGVACLVLMAGVIGSAIGAIVEDLDGVVAGASGLAYALIGFGLFQRNAPRGFSRLLRWTAGILLAVDLVSTAITPDDFDRSILVSTGGHIGGGIAGVLVALAVSQTSMRAHQRAIARTGFAIAAAWLVVAAIGFAQPVIEVPPADWSGPDSSGTRQLAPSEYPGPKTVERALRGLRAPGIGLVHSADCVATDGEEVVPCELQLKDSTVDAHVVRSISQLQLVVAGPPNARRAELAFATSELLEDEYDHMELESARCSRDPDERFVYECQGRNAAGAVLVGELRFRSADYIPERTFDLGHSAALTAERTGVTIDGSTAHLQRATCKGIEFATLGPLTCFATYLGHGYAVTIDLFLNRDQPVNLNDSGNLLQPMSGTAFLDALTNLEFTYEYGTPGTPEIVGGRCVPDEPIPFEDWACRLTFDDGRSESLEFHSDAARFVGLRGQDPFGELSGPYSHNVSGTISVPKRAAPKVVARRRLELDLTTVERLVQSRPFDALGDTKQTMKPETVDCRARPGSDDPLSSAYLCFVTFTNDVWRTFGVDVMPSDLVYAYGVDEDLSPHLYRAPYA